MQPILTPSSPARGPGNQRPNQLLIGLHGDVLTNYPSLHTDVGQPDTTR
jgi:hypothetical protein